MVQVHLFAGLRELAKTPRVEMEWAPNLSVMHVREMLNTCHPALIPLLARSNIAVNDQLATDSTHIPDGAEVACLPPVSGG